MKRNLFFKILVPAGMITLSSCVKDSLDPVDPSVPESTVQTMDELEIPSAFDFTTSSSLTINISDDEDGVRYTLLVDGANVFNGFSNAGNLSGLVTIPSAAENYVLIRTAVGGSEEFVISESGDSITFQYN